MIKLTNLKRNRRMKRIPNEQLLETRELNQTWCNHEWKPTRRSSVPTPKFWRLYIIEEVCSKCGTINTLEVSVSMTSNEYKIESEVIIDGKSRKARN